METQENENKEMDLINQMFTSLEKDEEFNTKFETAKMFLQVDDKTLGDVNQILKHFLTQYNTSKQAETLEQFLPDLIDSRNVLVRTNLLTQIYDRGQFVIPGDPFKNSCERCHGTGELYLFNRITKEVTCNRCEQGKVWVTCRSCHGTGRYKVRYKEGGGVDLKCRSCKNSPPNHQGQMQVRCRACLGTMSAKITVLDYSMKSTTACPVCDSLGFLPPKPEWKPKTPDNPVLAGDLAEKIKSEIPEDTEYKIDDTKFFDSPK